MNALSHFPRWLILALTVVLAAAVLAACGGDEEEDEAAPAQEATATEGEAGGEPSEPVKLSLALDWFPNPDHIPLYYAEEQGFFEDENLTVEMKTPSDPTAGLKLVAQKRFDIAVFYEGDMFFAAEQELPVIAVGAMIPQPLNSLMALKDGPIQDPCDVKGRTIGVAGLPFDDAMLASIRNECGLSEGDVKKVNVGFNLVPALLSKRADGVIGAYWNIEGFHVEEEAGEHPTIFRMDDLGVPHYDELVIVAHRDRLEQEEEYADAVRRFLAAMVEGSDAAREAEDDVIATMEEETDYKPAEIEAMVPPTLSTLESPQGLPTGCMSLEGWQEFGQWMLDNELLKDEVDPATIATNEYLPHECE